MSLDDIVKGLFRPPILPSGLLIGHVGDFSKFRSSLSHRQSAVRGLALFIEAKFGARCPLFLDSCSDFIVGLEVGVPLECMLQFSLELEFIRGSVSEVPLALSQTSVRLSDLCRSSAMCFSNADILVASSVWSAFNGSVDEGQQ
jgi:hypothetical protein